MGVIQGERENCFITELDFIIKYLTIWTVASSKKLNDFINVFS